MSKLFRCCGQALKILILAALCLALICNLYLIAQERITGESTPGLWGYSLAVVVSGSMEPAIHVDDLIVNRAQESYAPGDIITFRSGGSLTTHRIIGESGEGLITQGDANNTADPQAVSPADVVGRVVLRVPYVGRVISLLKTPLGMTALFVAGFVLLAFPLIFHGQRTQPDKEGT